MTTHNIDIKRYRALPLPEGGVRAVEAPMGAFCMYSDVVALLTTAQNQAYEMAAQHIDVSFRDRGSAFAAAIRRLKTPTVMGDKPNGD